MDSLQTRLKWLKRRTEKENRRVTARWGWKLRFVHCAVASATKEMGKIRLDVWRGAEQWCG